MENYSDKFWESLRAEEFGCGIKEGGVGIKEGNGIDSLGIYFYFSCYLSDNWAY